MMKIMKLGGTAKFRPILFSLLNDIGLLLLGGKNELQSQNYRIKMASILG